MKCVTIEPVSIGGVRVEVGHEVEIDGPEFLQLSRLGAIEPADAHRARKDAEIAIAKARAAAAVDAAKLMADAEEKAKRAVESATADAEAKVDKSAAGARGRAARAVVAEG